MHCRDVATLLADSWNGDNLNGCFDIEFVSACDGRATVRMPYSKSVTQPNGLFHAGAIVALADVAATAAAFSSLHAAGENNPKRLPLAFQISTNLVGNTGRGMLVAEAEVLSLGRTVIVAQARVVDETSQPVAIVTATLRRPPAEGAAKT